jgi:hypothetical protein
VITQYVYAKDAQAVVHEPHQCRDSIAALEILFVQESEDVRYIYRYKINSRLK